MTDVKISIITACYNNESTIINQFDDESNDSQSESASQSESLQSLSDMSDNLEEFPFLPSEDNSST